MKTLLTFLLLSCTCLFAQIDKLENFSDLLDLNRQEALFIFDVDEVLTTSTNPALRSGSIYAHKDDFLSILGKLSPVEQGLFLMSMNVACPRMVVDRCAPDVVGELQCHAKVIALTASLTGDLPPVGDCVTWRIHSLRRQGFDFSLSCPRVGMCQFYQFPPFWYSYPTLADGILFANFRSVDKGTLLVTYLEMAGLTPERIYFVDDQMKYLLAVEEALSKNYPQIEFRGFHYTRARQLEPATRDACLDEWEALVSDVQEIYEDTYGIMRSGSSNR